MHTSKSRFERFLLPFNCSTLVVLIDSLRLDNAPEISFWLLRSTVPEYAMIKEPLLSFQTQFKTRSKSSHKTSGLPATSVTNRSVYLNVKQYFLAFNIMNRKINNQQEGATQPIHTKTCIWTLSLLSRRNGSSNSFSSISPSEPVK